VKVDLARKRILKALRYKPAGVGFDSFCYALRTGKLLSGSITIPAGVKCRRLVCVECAHDLFDFIVLLCLNGDMRRWKRGTSWLKDWILSHAPSSRPVRE